MPLPEDSSSDENKPSSNFANFVNRGDEEAVFVGLLERKADEDLPVLMFYAMGGTGKSWLLEKLWRDRCRDYGLPWVQLNFSRSLEAGGIQYLDDPALVFAQISRQFNQERDQTRFHVPCPRFELAYQLYRYKQMVRDDAPTIRAARVGGPTIDALLPDIVEGAGELAKDLPVPTNFITFLVKKTAQSAGKPFRNTRMYEWLSSAPGDQDLRDLDQKTAQQILPLRPRRLRGDLKEALPPRPHHRCRAVLFLDTFESLTQGLASGAHKDDPEEWIRKLCGDLNHAGVLVVIAGQNRLAWEKRNAAWGEERNLIQFRLDGLTRPYAATFLQKCGIEPGELLEAILASSRDADQYLPLKLGLLADAVAEEQEQGREPEVETFRLDPDDLQGIVKRFLRSLPTEEHQVWMERLALTPRFDESAARRALTPGDPLSAQALVGWRSLRGYSFVSGITDEGVVMAEVLPGDEEEIRSWVDGALTPQTSVPVTLQ